MIYSYNGFSIFFFRGVCLLSLLVFYSCSGEDDSDDEVNNAPTISNTLSDVIVTEGFQSTTVTVGDIFADADEDVLTYSVSSSNDNVASATISGSSISISEVGVGVTTIAVTANDGNGGSVTDGFQFTVEEAIAVEVILEFGSSSGNQLEIAGWTEVPGSSGYMIVMSDDNSISDLENGASPAASTSYLGYGEQVVFNGSSVSELEVSLLQDSKTYYFKVFPYSGNNVFDVGQEIQESRTSSCSTSSTTVSEVCFSVDAQASTRTISSNQYPSHEVGTFPNADPTAISVTRVLDLSPEKAASITYVFNETSGPTPQNPNFYQFGIASNGVEFHPMGLKPWANPSSGEENWEWQEQVTKEGQTGLDAFGAHVTSQGNYHYHGDIVALASEEDGSRHSLLYGFAGDGFPIYYKFGYSEANDNTGAVKELLSSHQLKSGSRPGDGTLTPSGTYDGTYIQDYEYIEGLGDLDECNGRTGVTPEFPGGTYYYVITSDFPVTPNCFAGTPDADWQIGR